VYEQVSGDSHLSRGLFLPIDETLFVAGTYDLLENLGEVLEQFHGLAAQYWILLSRHHLARYVNAKSKRTPRRKAEKRGS